MVLSCRRNESRENWGGRKALELNKFYVSTTLFITSCLILEKFVRKTKVTDDTAIWDEELKEHWWRMIDYLELVGKHGIILNSEKFQFCQRSVDFAGFRVSENKVEPLPKYLNAIGPSLHLKSYKISALGLA